MSIESGSKYSAVLIGCGGIGYRFDRHSNKPGALTHFRSLRRSGRFNVIGISDPDDEIRAEIEKLHGIKGYRDYRDLFSGGTPDLVVVATPDETHDGILSTLLQYRPRLVFCEKPVAHNLHDIESLATRYESTRVGLAVNYTRRFLAEYADIKRRISDGDLGRVYSVSIYYSRGFLHNACHYLDLLHWWFGQPERLMFEGKRRGLKESDPTLSVLLGYEQGIEVRLVGLETNDTLMNEIDIIGTAGRLRIDTLGNIEISRPQAHPDYDMFRHYVTEERRLIDQAHALPRAFDNLGAWLDGERELLTPVQSSLTVQHTIDKILKLENE